MKFILGELTTVYFNLLLFKNKLIINYMNWLKENKQYISNLFWALLFLAIIYFILTTPTDMGSNVRSFDLGGKW